MQLPLLVIGFNFLKPIDMKILRTDSGGENYTDERLRTLRKMLLHFEIKNIYLLHDHKGILTVIWDSEPNKQDLKKIEEAWEFFHEDQVYHKLVTFKEL
jgi:hypothetical protein